MTGMTPSVLAIKCHVAKAFGIPRNSMEGPQRNRQVARPRQVAMFMAATMTRHSYPEIGRMFGGRDHTTVIHAVRRIKELIENDPDFAEQVEEVKTSLGAPAAFEIGESTDDLEEAARQACKAAVRRAKTEMGASVSGRPDTLRRTLQEAYGERPTFTGMTRDGHSVELLTSPKGTWSMIEVSGDGELARMIISGFEAQTPAAPPPPPVVRPAPAAPPSPPSPPAFPRVDACMRCQEPFTRTASGHRHCAECRNFLDAHGCSLEA